MWAIGSIPSCTKSLVRDQRRNSCPLCHIIRISHGSRIARRAALAEYMSRDIWGWRINVPPQCARSAVGDAIWGKRARRGAACAALPAAPREVNLGGSMGGALNNQQSNRPLAKRKLLATTSPTDGTRRERACDHRRSSTPRGPRRMVIELTSPHPHPAARRSRAKLAQTLVLAL